jgi:cytochrome c-type biogenesis protein CcmF
LVSLGAALGLGMAVWLGVGSIIEWLERVKITRSGAWTRIANLPRAAHGMTLAHVGMAVLIAGVTGSSAWKQERIQTMAPGQQVEIAGYTLTMKGVDVVPGPNYQAARATIDVTKDGRPVTTLHPERHNFQQPQQQTTNTAIHTTGYADLYAALGDAEGAEGAFVTRFFYQPLVPFIWYGALLMGLGGLVSLTDRRHRVGAPRRAAAPAMAVPAAAE